LISKKSRGKCVFSYPLDVFAYVGVLIVERNPKKEGDGSCARQLPII